MSRTTLHLLLWIALEAFRLYKSVLSQAKNNNLTKVVVWLALICCVGCSGGHTSISGIAVKFDDLAEFRIQALSFGGVSPATKPTTQLVE